MRALALLLALALAAPAAAQRPLVLTPGQRADALPAHAGVLVGGPESVEALLRAPAPFRRAASLYPEAGGTLSTDAPYWVRVELRSASARPALWVVPFSFEDVAAVLVHADRRQDVFRTGTRIPRAQRSASAGPASLAGRPVGIRIALDPGETATLYLRVRHRVRGYTDMVAARPVEYAAFASARRRSDVWNGMALGGLLALAIYNLFLFASFRDRSYLFYVAFLLATSAYWAVTWGYAAEFVWPARLVLPPELQFAALAAAAMAYAQFVRLFVGARTYAPHADRVLIGVIGLWAAAFATGWTVSWPVGQLVAAAAGLVLLGATLAAGVTALRAGFRPARAYLIAAAPFLLVGTAFSVLFVIDPVRGGGALPALQSAILAEAVGLSVALAVRIQTLRSERAEAAEALRRAEEAGEALREASDLKTHLLGITAHDLRSPLTSIAGAAEMVAFETPDRPDLHEFTDLIQRGSARMLALIDDLLVTAAIDGGQVELHRAATDLAALAADVVADYAPRAVQKGQTLTLAHVPATVHADASRIRAVLDNLVSNAVKYTPHGGCVSVQCEARGADAVVRVSDTGPGLSPADVGHLYERFRPLTPRPTGGESSTGLGLSIAREFARLHGGRIDVESRLGEGTTFTLVLPAEAVPRRDLARQQVA